MTDKIYCGLDIGSYAVKTAVIRAGAGNEYQLLGVYQLPAAGYKNGSVSDINLFSDSIFQSVNQLGTKLSLKIKDVHLAIGGSFVNVRSSSTLIPLVERSSKIITQRDVAKVNNQARLLGIKMEEESLHDLPQRYQVDDVASIINPVGMYARKLGVNTMMVVANTNRVRNLTKAVSQAGYDVPQLYFGSYITHQLVLSDDEINHGCVLIDMGATSTGILVFSEGSLKFYDVLQMGGEHFTQAIAQALHLSFELAEEIKQSYVDVSLSDSKSEEEILVKRENGYIPVKRKMIHDAIFPLTEQLVQSISTSLKNSGLFHQVNRGIVMVGGGCLLPGLMERIDQMVLSPVRMGTTNVNFQKNMQSSAIFINAIAAAKMGSLLQDKKAKKKQEQGSWFQNMGYRLRDIYQEYF